MHAVLLSTYAPRRCGLAAFTADLRAALRMSVPRWHVDVCAVDRDGLAYGPEVIEVVNQDERDDYRWAARAVAAERPDLVVIEHEYGIFGGPDGSYVLDFADELTAHGVPYVVTLHTVLAAPSPGQAGVLAGLCRGAARVTGFTETARTLATRAGAVDPDQFVVVPHGVPEQMSRPVDSAVLGPAVAEALASLDGARVLSTFGLLRPGKGLETAISALPAVVARHPDVRYVVAGATHPEIVRSSGEAYREALTGLSRELGIADHVQFVDAFLTDAELAALLARTTVYLTPYRSAEQTCSGALTFAVAAGCAVVSTSYRYAMDLVTPPGGEPCGALVPFDDPAAFAEAVSDLLADPVRLAAARAASRRVGKDLSWPAVGARFAEVCAEVARPRGAAAPAGSPTAPARAPVVSSVRMRPARLRNLVVETARASTGGDSAWSASQQPPTSTSPAT